jgi:sigma-B regulation protein RsbU (phosphoserine phosphatase)
LTAVLNRRVSAQAAKLKASEERYRRFFERSLSGIYQGTLDGKLVDCNQAFARILGYASREECLAIPMSKHYLVADDRGEFVARLMNEDSLYDFESKLRERMGVPCGFSRRHP